MHGKEILDVDSSQTAQTHRTYAASVWCALGGKPSTLQAKVRYGVRTRGERLHTEQTLAVVCGKPREEALRVIIGETGTSKHSTGCKEIKWNLFPSREPRGATQGHALPAQHEGEGSGSLTL